MNTVKTHFQKEEKIMQGYMNLVQGKVPKVDEWMEEYIKRTTRSSLLEALHNLIDVLLKEACIKEQIDISRTPGVFRMMEYILEKNSPDKIVFPIEVKKQIDLLRHKRGPIPHKGKTKFTIAEIQLYTGIAFRVLQWFYNQYYDIKFPDSLHVIESEESNGSILALTDQTKPTSKTVATFKKLLQKDLERLDRQLRWDINDFTHIKTKVRVAEGRKVLRRKRELQHDFGNRIQKRWSEKQSSRFLLLGEPGSGKSVALRKLCIDLNVSWRQSYILVYISLRDWDYLAQPDIELYIYNTLIQHSNTKVVDFIKKYFVYMLRHQKFLFLLDSFDEIPVILSNSSKREYISKISHELNQFQISTKTPCIVASRKFKRPTELDFSPDITYTLESLTEVDILKTYTATFSKSKLPFSTLQQIYNSPYLCDLMTSPLTIAFIRSYMAKNSGALPENKTVLYTNVIEGKLDDALLRIDDSIEKKHILEYAKQIAANAQEDEHFGLNTPKESLVQTFRLKKVPVEKAIEILESCHLVRVAKGQSRVAFIHRSIHDYFYALHWKDTYQEWDDKTIKRNRNACIIFLEIAHETSVRTLFWFCWQKMEYLREQTGYKTNEAYRDGLFYLRLLMDGLRGKTHMLSDFQKNRIEQFIDFQLEKGQNLIVKKHALEAAELLNYSYIINEGFKKYGLQQNSYIANILFRTSRKISQLQGHTYQAFRLHYSEKFRKTLFSEPRLSFWSYLEGPFYFSSIYRIFRLARVLQIYKSSKSIGLRFIFNIGLFAVTQIWVCYECIRVFVAEATQFVNIGSLEEGSSHLFNMVLIVPGYFLMVIFVWYIVHYLVFLPYITQRTVISTVRGKKNGNDVGMLEFGFLSLLLGTSSLIFAPFISESLSQSKTISSIISMVVGVVLILLSPGVFHDVRLWLKSWSTASPRWMARSELAQQFYSYKTTFFRVRLMKWVHRTNMEIDSNSAWPDEVLPNVDDDEASGIMAEMEEDLLGLSDTY